jgi:hypothetical protein
MDGQLIWDAIATLTIVVIVLVAFAAMTWWSITEVLKTMNRHLRPPAARWTRKLVRRVREWKTSKTR